MAFKLICLLVGALFLGNVGAMDEEGNCEFPACVEGVCSFLTAYGFPPCQPPVNFITQQRSTQNLWRIDNDGSATVFGEVPTAGSSLGMMRVGSTVYVSWKSFDSSFKGIYQFVCCDANPAIITQLVDFTSIFKSSFMGDMAYLESTDQLLVFLPYDAWYSVHRTTGSYNKLYPTDGSSFSGRSFGSLVVNGVLYWTTRESSAKLYQLDVSDPLNLPAHTEVAPGFNSSYLRDLVYFNGLIYILDENAYVYSYDPSVGGMPQLVIEGTNEFATSLTWFNATHIIISKVNANNVAIVEIGTPSSPTPASEHQVFASIAFPLPIINLDDYYTPGSVLP